MPLKDMDEEATWISPILINFLAFPQARRVYCRHGVGDISLWLPECYAGLGCSPAATG